MSTYREEISLADKIDQAHKIDHAYELINEGIRNGDAKRVGEGITTLISYESLCAGYHIGSAWSKIHKEPLIVTWEELSKYVGQSFLGRAAHIARLQVSERTMLSECTIDAAVRDAPDDDDVQTYCAFLSAGLSSEQFARFKEKAKKS